MKLPAAPACRQLIAQLSSTATRVQHSKSGWIRQ